MQAVITSGHKILVGAILTRLQADITTTREAQEARLADQKRQQEAQAAARSAKQEAERVVWERRMPLAKQGLQAILALGMTDEIQSIFRLQAESDGREIPENVPMAPQISLYHASRASGDAWDTRGKLGSGTRDVYISLRAKHFYLEYGCLDIDPQVCKLPYAATEEAMDRELGSLYSPFEESAGQALRRPQWTYHWDAEGLAFQVLVDCADPKKLARHLRRGLAEIAEGCRRV